MNWFTKLLYRALRLPKVLKGKDIYFSVQTSVKNITLGDLHQDWTIATDNINSNSKIYSFGVGTNISFDLEIIEKFNVNVFAFDPTPKSIQWIKEQELPENFKFYPYGIDKFNGEVEFTLPENENFVSGSIENHLGSSGKTIKVPVKNLKSIMSELKHNSIDLLKMDIEGSEYDVIDDIVENNISIKQLLVEFHHRFPKIGISKTKEAIRKLNAYGYKIFYISYNGEEYSFIKE